MGGRLTEVQLSPEQRTAFRAITHWFEHDTDSKQVIRLGGFGGTGKTRLIATLAAHYEGKAVVFATYTGKAASVLRAKLRDAGARVSSPPQTIHSLMYYPAVDPRTGAIIEWRKREMMDHDLIIIDEASMLSEAVYKDLIAYGIPVLLVGDHGQLGPVGEGAFNLMSAPELRLERIHRQAEDNPIIQLASFVRRTGHLPRMEPSAEVQVLPHSHIDDIIRGLYGHGELTDTVFICPSNQKRIELNGLIRQARFDNTSSPQVGDAVICLRNTEGKVFNGMRGVLRSIEPFKNGEKEYTRYNVDDHYRATIFFEDEELEVTGPVSRYQFDLSHTLKDFESYKRLSGKYIHSWKDMGLLVDYGYALTAHKAQASEWDQVVVDMSQMRSNWSLDERRRWAYTAISRASKYLTILT